MFNLFFLFRSWLVTSWRTTSSWLWGASVPLQKTSPRRWCGWRRRTRGPSSSTCWTPQVRNAQTSVFKPLPSLPWRSHRALTHHPAFVSLPHAQLILTLLRLDNKLFVIDLNIKIKRKKRRGSEISCRVLGVCFFCCESFALSSLTFTGRFGFILVIPSEVQENVTEAPEKPGECEHTITSLRTHKPETSHPTAHPVLLPPPPPPPPLPPSLPPPLSWHSASVFVFYFIFISFLVRACLNLPCTLRKNSKKGVCFHRQLAQRVGWLS